MEILERVFASMGLDVYNFGITVLVLMVGSLLCGLVGRFVFGKRSLLNNVVSSAIGILFIYAATVVMKSAGAAWDHRLPTLPFVEIAQNHLMLFRFQGAHYTVICSELLSMVILAFLVNVVDGWFSRAKSFLGWLFCRILCVVLGFILYLAVLWAFGTFLPKDLATYAPTVLLGILVLLLLTGVLKFVVGAALTTVNPIIGGLYTFFFATVIGKQVTKAVLTTLLLTGLVLLLRYLGVTSVYTGLTALYAYIPFALGFVGLWYLASRVL